jgi:hypothetical protein
MQMLPKTLCLPEVGQGMSDVNSVSKMKLFITYFLPDLLPNIYGVVWQDPLLPLPDLGIFLSSSGGFLNSFQQVEMFRYLG